LRPTADLASSDRSLSFDGIISATAALPASWVRSLNEFHTLRHRWRRGGELAERLRHPCCSEGVCGTPTQL
jgi:hypothetical protein